MLKQVGAPFIGTVLNGVTGEGSYGYGYQYYRYEQASPARRGAARRNGSQQPEIDLDLEVGAPSRP